MKDLDPATITALGSSVVALAVLVLIEFPSGDVCLNTSNWDLVHGGKTYLGANGLGSISPIEDSPGEVKGLEFELAGVSSSSISLALDDAGELKGVPITISVAIFSQSTYQILEADPIWTGTGDTLTLVEDGANGVIKATAESSAVVLLRGSPLTYTDADQQMLFPGDRAFENVVAQVGKPVVWPTKQFFQR